MADGIRLVGWQVASARAGQIGDPSGLADHPLEWLAAPVPGTVADALRVAGRWDEAEGADLDRDDWWFRCRFAAPAGPARLHFGGLATIAEVWLDGQLVLCSDNMFVADDVDVELAEENDLVVVCRSLTCHLAARRPRGRWRTRLVEQQQMRWVRTSFLGRMPSWNPAAAPVGLWRPVTVLPAEPPMITVRGVRAMLDGDDGVLQFEAELRGAPPLAAWVEVDGVRAPLSVSPGDGMHVLDGSVRLPSVSPWFPATHGAPSRSQVAVTVNGVDGVHRLDVGKVGFRRIDLHDEDGKWRLSVNGVDVFCRGANWVPTDPVRLSDDPETIRRAVQDLVDAGCNMVRIPGITVYEQPELYEACDDLGVMVWHDLMFANLDHPVDDPGFRASIDVEIEQFLRSCQLHPSVVVVCGGSEVEQQAAMMGVAPADARNRVGREVLPPLLDRLLPDVVHAPCSPHGGTFPFHVGQGVSHYYGVGAYLRPLSDARTSGVRFATECLAFAAVPCRQTVEEMLGDGERPGHWPSWKRGVPRDRGAGWDFEDVRDHYVAELFGESPAQVRYVDPDRYLDLGRAAAAIAVESTLAELRRAGSTCGGALVFLLRDARLGAGWGLVDSRGRRKSTWFALARASAPCTALLRDEGLDGVWSSVFNDRAVPLAAGLQFRAFGADGSLMAAGSTLVELDAHSSCEVSVDGALGHFRDLSYAYRFGPQQVDVVEASLVDAAGVELSRAHWLAGGARRPVRDDVGVSASAVEVGEHWEIRLAADRFAQFVSIEGDDLVLSDNWFHLAPGAERVVRCIAPNGIGPGAIQVRALNGYGARAVRVDGRVG